MREVIDLIAKSIGYIIGAGILGAVGGVFFGMFYFSFKMVAGWFL